MPSGDSALARKRFIAHFDRTPAVAPPVSPARTGSVGRAAQPEQHTLWMCGARRQRKYIYICPNGKLLHTTGTVIDGSTLRYRASKLDCDACAFKMQCCPHTPARQVPRDLHEDARDVARVASDGSCCDELFVTPIKREPRQELWSHSRSTVRRAKNGSPSVHPIQGDELRALQAWLGHKNIQHTVRYTELAPDRFKNFWR
jgi:hypothetical protein